MKERKTLALREAVIKRLPYSTVSGVAREFGLSRTTVIRIRNGVTTTGRQRCPGCGGKVYGRCRLCYIRSLLDGR